MGDVLVATLNVLMKVLEVVDVIKYKSFRASIASNPAGVLIEQLGGNKSDTKYACTVNPTESKS